MAFIVRRPGIRSYATNFPATENPISEGGVWINGAARGVDWLDVQTSPGLAFGTGVSPSPPYSDPTAVLTGAWGPLQTAEATVVVPASPSGSQEVELRLLTAITPHRIVGYEVLFSVTTNAYVDIERWDGGTALSDFFSLVPGGFDPLPQQLATGNRIKATVNASGVIVAYVDYGAGYVQVATGTDTTYTSGAPGIGFFIHNTTDTNFGLSSFSASAI